MLWGHIYESVSLLSIIENVEVFSRTTTSNTRILCSIGYAFLRASLYGCGVSLRLFLQGLSTTLD